MPVKAKKGPRLLSQATEEPLASGSTENFQGTRGARSLQQATHNVPLEGVSSVFRKDVFLSAL